MTSDITETRGEIAAALQESGVDVFDYVPELLSAPAYVMQPGSPWLTTDGEPFGSWKVAWLVSVIADVATNEVTTTALDDMVQVALVALANARIAAPEVSDPYRFTYNSAAYLAANITVITSINP